MDTFGSDLRLALRLLWKKPGFTVVAMITLALGIAVNATMFSMVSAFLVRRPAGRDVDRLVVVSSVNPNPVFLPDVYPVSAPDYLEWRRASDLFTDTAAADESRTANLSALRTPAAAGQTAANGSGAAAESTTESQPEALRCAAVSSNYFGLLGISPRIGRAFADGEDQPGRDHVVILSHDLWVRRFAGDTSVNGRTIRLNRESYTIVGVMPASFRLLGFTPQLWIPLVLSASDQTAAARKDHSLYFFARLKAGVTVDQARAEMAALARRTAENFPETEKGWGATARTLPDFLIYNFSIRSALAVLMTAVGFILMIACANVAGLLLARATGRRKELAIRISLGAGRGRIVRQLLTEGLVIAILGGAFGLLLSYWGIEFLQARLTFNEAISAVPIRLDWNVLLFAMGISLASALLSGLAPALKASRTDVNSSLKDESRAASSSRSHTRLRTILVTAEIAMAMFLLIGTGLLIRSIFIIEHQELGFQADHLLTADVALDDARYKDASQQALFVRDLIPRLQQIPGAELVAVTSALPATGPGRVTFQIKDQTSASLPEQGAAQRPSALDVVVTKDFFQAAGIPLLQGRTFTAMDNATAPHVVVVNQEFVHRHLRNREPLGKQISLDVSGTAPGWSEIIGVVGNVKSYSEGTRDDPQVYEAFEQRPIASFSLIIRASFNPSSLASALRTAVAQIDSELPLARVMSMPELIERQRAGDPLFVRFLGSFAVLALLLAAIGIYGLIAYSVGQRTHEIGIRMAVGAGTLDVLRMVLWEGVKMAAIGGALGLALALPLPKIFESIFYDLHVGEPRIYFIVALVILAVAVLATYVPARHATRVDPMAALRQE